MQVTPQVQQPCRLLYACARSSTHISTTKATDQFIPWSILVFSCGDKHGDSVHTSSRELNLTRFVHLEFVIADKTARPPYTLDSEHDPCLGERLSWTPLVSLGPGAWPSHALSRVPPGNLKTHRDRQTCSSRWGRLSTGPLSLEFTSVNHTPRSVCTKWRSFRCEKALRGGANSDLT